MSDDVERTDEPVDPRAAEQNVMSDADEQFPWQRRESVDLDLHGAPTWDPSQYEPMDDDDSSPSRGGLFRRSRPRPRPSPSPGLAHLRRPGVESTDAAELTARLEAEQREAEMAQAERVETERKRAEAQRQETARIEAARADAERRREAQKLEAERAEAERREVERVEVERAEAERLEVERAEVERAEADRVEAERAEADRVEAARVESERAAAARVALAELAAPRSAQRRVEVPTDEQVPIDLVDPDDLNARPAEPTSQRRPVRQPAASPADPTEVVSVAKANPPALTEAPPSAEAPPIPADRPSADQTTSHTATSQTLAGLPSSTAELAPEHRPSPFANPMPTMAETVVDRHIAAPADPPDHEYDEKAGSDAPSSDDDRPPAKAGFLRRRRRAFVRTAITLVIAAAVAVLLRVFVVQPYYIPSESMEPTLHGCTGCTDDRVIVNKLSYRIHDVHAGDIVVFNKPRTLVSVKDNVLIKRVIALGGDTLTLKKDQVYVNGLQLQESYLNTAFLAKNCPGQVARPETATTTWKIPTDDVFVMGDNRCNSEDGRTFGPIAKDSIIGRAAFIIWPLSRIGGL